MKDFGAPRQDVGALDIPQAVVSPNASPVHQTSIQLHQAGVDARPVSGLKDFGGPELPPAAGVPCPQPAGLLSLLSDTPSQPSPVSARCGNMSAAATSPVRSLHGSELNANNSPMLPSIQATAIAPAAHSGDDEGGLPNAASADLLPRVSAEAGDPPSVDEQSSPSATSSQPFPVIYQALTLPGSEPAPRVADFTDIHTKFVGMDPQPSTRAVCYRPRRGLRRSASVNLHHNSDK